MSPLFACTCNQPQRLPEALAPLRDHLAFRPPVSSWGLGYVADQEILLRRSPGRQERRVDVYSTIAAIQSDYLIACASSDASAIDPQHIPPYRFGTLMLAAQTATCAELPWTDRALTVPPPIARAVPERTGGQLFLRLLLEQLRDEAQNGLRSFPIEDLLRAIFAIFSRLLKRERCGIQQIVLSNMRELLAIAVEQPIYVRRLQVETAPHEAEFRGVLVCARPAPGNGFEEVPAGSVVLISRSLDRKILSLAEAATVR